MGWLRTGLPLAIIAAGLISIVATGGKEWSYEGGLLLISAGLSVWLLNFFFRVGAKGDLERDEEDRAREFYDEQAPRSFLLDTTLPRSPWWIYPGLGDAAVSFRTPRRGTHRAGTVPLRQAPTGGRAEHPYPHAPAVRRGRGGRCLRAG